MEKPLLFILKKLMVFMLYFAGIAGVAAWLFTIIQICSGETNESRAFKKYADIMTAAAFLSVAFILFLAYIYSLIES
jgi:hypothetical protein